MQSTRWAAGRSCISLEKSRTLDWNICQTWPIPILLLGRTNVGDQGLVHLKNLKQLDFLVLDKSQVTDAGLSHLKGLPNQARLPHLEGLSKLPFLELGNTKVTDEGVKNLSNSLPRLEGVR